jgi:hypothetical protein
VQHSLLLSALLVDESGFLGVYQVEIMALLLNLGE